MLSPSWETVLASRPAPEQAHVRDVLSELETRCPFGLYAVPNLTKDRFLPEGVAELFVDLLSRQSIPVDLSTLKRDYVDLCNDHALCGSEIELSPIPPRLGRGTDKESFIAQMVRVNHTSAPTIRTLLTKLEKGSLRPTEQRKLAGMLMSEYGAWVTWDYDSGGVDAPFRFLRTKSAYVIRYALGLQINPAVIRNLPVLVFEYRAADVSVIQKPTITDGSDNSRFRVRSPPPPPDGDWFGLTAPWIDDPLGILAADDQLYPPPRPEAVHQRILFPAGLTCETHR